LLPFFCSTPAIFPQHVCHLSAALLHTFGSIAAQLRQHCGTLCAALLHKDCQHALANLAQSFFCVLERMRRAVFMNYLMQNGSDSH
jgi:hypothetical protein